MEAWRFAEEASTVSKTEAAAIQRKVAALQQTLENRPAGAEESAGQGLDEQEAAPGMPGLTND
jgi:hypothetical protein